MVDNLRIRRKLIKKVDVASKQSYVVSGRFGHLIFYISFFMFSFFNFQFLVIFLIFNF